MVFPPLLIYLCQIITLTLGFVIILYISLLVGVSVSLWSQGLMVSLWSQGLMLWWSQGLMMWWSYDVVVWSQGLVVSLCYSVVSVLSL